MMCLILISMVSQISITSGYLDKSELVVGANTTVFRLMKRFVQYFGGK